MAGAEPLSAPAVYRRGQPRRSPLWSSHGRLFFGAEPLPAPAGTRFAPPRRIRQPARSGTASGSGPLPFHKYSTIGLGTVRRASPSPETPPPGYPKRPTPALRSRGLSARGSPQCKTVIFRRHPAHDLAREAPRPKLVFGAPARAAAPLPARCSERSRFRLRSATASFLHPPARTAAPLRPPPGHDSDISERTWPPYPGRYRHPSRPKADAGDRASGNSRGKTAGSGSRCAVGFRESADGMRATTSHSCVTAKSCSSARTHSPDRMRAAAVAYDRRACPPQYCADLFDPSVPSSAIPAGAGSRAAPTFDI